MQIKPADSDRFLARADPSVRLILIYGSDDGLVAERAARFARVVVGDSDDPFSQVRLDAATLADDPVRLADEAHTVPLFGGRRCITVRLSGNWSIVPAVEAVLKQPPVDSWVVVTGGDLRKTSPVRRLFEQARDAAVIVCYADSARDLDRLIDEELAAAGLRMAGDARAALRQLIGSNRLASRSEVAKLCLYAAGSSEITVDDVRAVVADASAFAVDEAVDAAALGDAETFARLYGRLIAGGTGDYTVAGAALRHFDYLHRARARVDAGESADGVIGPPIFFRRKTAVARQIRLWPTTRIMRALELLDKAIIDSRLHNAISAEIVGQAMLAVAAMAQPAQARGDRSGR